MAQVTIDQLPELQVISGEDDYAVVWDDSTNTTAKISINKLIASSDFGAGNRGPGIVRGELGTQISMYKVDSKTKSTRQIAGNMQSTKNKTFGFNNMFAQDSTVFGQIDVGVMLVKSAGDNTVYVHDHINGHLAVSVGGGEKTGHLPRHYRASNQDLRYPFTISCNVNSLTLKSGGYMSVFLQVWA